MGAPKCPAPRSPLENAPYPRLFPAQSRRWHPKTRTSFTPRISHAVFRRPFRMLSMRRIFACQSWDKSSLTEAQATAHASGFAINVGPCMNTPASAARNRFGDFCEVIAAPASYSAAQALAIHIISGTTFACSQANILPVRPNPVAISSKSTRYQIHRTNRANREDTADDKNTCRPRPATTGSKIKAAISA